MTPDRQDEAPAEPTGERTDGGAPMARFTSPETVAVGDRVTFRAAKSLDASASIDSYEWTVEDGDSERIHTASGPTLAHTFEEGGDYRVSLVATADDATATYVESMTVQRPPRARVSYEGDRVAGEPMTFDGIPSVDRDGRVVGYEWEIRDGEGGETLATGNGSEITFTFPEPGWYEVALVITDDAGLTDRWSSRTWIKKPGNEQPTAEFEFVPEHPEAGETVRFDAGPSTDPDGRIVKYEWTFLTDTSDWDEIGTATGNVATQSFPEPGEYVADLLVLGDQRERSVMQHLVEVEPADG
jgi:plastocyanin